MIDQLPWEKDLPFAPLRVVWILVSIFLLPSIFITALSIPETSAILVSSLAALLACFGRKEELGFKSIISGSDLLIVAAAYAGIVFLVAIISPLWVEVLNKLQISYATEQDIAALFRDAGFLDHILLFISTCIITPIVEEVLFRRIIYGWFCDLTDSRNAFFITAACFSIAHFFILGIPGLFIMGIAFQLVYLWKKNLLLSILLHALVNTIATLCQIFFPEKFPG
ncbi:MAG: CPBP family intramembrane metalloprotease [Lentisphaeria bacterium]|nr:CPBP family intramembrane metalloprotease [Lentisphaeria bacterium]